MSVTAYPTDEANERESLFRTSASAVSNAAVDARASAKAAAQNVKDGIGRGTYRAAFGLSFGVVFTGVFLTELLPGNSSLRRGLEDGASDALDAIEVRRSRSENIQHDESASGDPTTEPAVKTWAKDPAPRPRRTE